MKMSLKSMEPTFANKVLPKKTLDLPMLIAHMTITMQTSIAERNKQIVQSSMLMMMIQMQTYQMKMKKYVQFVRTDLVKKLNWGK
jgi:hypothetical protein